MTHEPPRPIRLASALALVLRVTACVLSSTAPAAPANDAWRLPTDDRAAIERLAPIFIDAVNAPDDASRHALVSRIFDAAELERVGADRIVRQFASVAERFPGLRFDRADLSETRMGDRVSRVLHVYARNPAAKMWSDLQLVLADAPPHRIARLAFIAEVSAPIALPNTEIPSPAAIDWLNEYVDTLARDYDLAGAALIAVGDRVVFERAFGFADAQRTTPVTPDTRFSLASASKMFTALGVASLVADGRLAYSDTLDKFFPDFPDQDAARAVTIGHLLSHSSGIAEYWTPATDDAVRSARSTADMLPLVFNAGSAFAPGSRHAYSNSNFILAGMIIERVAGQPYDEFIRRLIFTPLAMSHSGFFETGDPSLPIAEALGRDADAWQALPRNGRGTAAGGCLSTTHDMLRFVRGLVAGKIVPRAALALLTTSKVIPGVETDSDYAYGFLLQSNAQVRSFGHGGIARGVNAEVRYFPSLDTTLILLNNQDNGAYDDLRKNATRLITGER